MVTIFAATWSPAISFPKMLLFVLMTHVPEKFAVFSNFTAEERPIIKTHNDAIQSSCFHVIQMLIAEKMYPHTSLISSVTFIYETEKKVIIPFTKIPFRNFKKHLEDDENERIIFSAKIQHGENHVSRTILW